MSNLPSYLRDEPNTTYSTFENAARKNIGSIVEKIRGSSYVPKPLRSTIYGAAKKTEEFGSGVAEGAEKLGDSIKKHPKAATAAIIAAGVTVPIIIGLAVGNHVMQTTFENLKNNAFLHGFHNNGIIPSVYDVTQTQYSIVDGVLPVIKSVPKSVVDIIGHSSGETLKNASKDSPDFGKALGYILEDWMRMAVNDNLPTFSKEAADTGILYGGVAGGASGLGSAVLSYKGIKKVNEKR